MAARAAIGSERGRGGTRTDGFAVFKKGITFLSWDFEHAELFAAIDGGKNGGKGKGVVHLAGYVWSLLLEEDAGEHRWRSDFKEKKFDLTLLQLGTKMFAWCLPGFGGDA